MYHNSLRNNKFVGALVASINKTFTRFISSAEFQSNQSELTDRMTRASRRPSGSTWRSTVSSRTGLSYTGRPDPVHTGARGGCHQGLLQAERDGEGQVYLHHCQQEDQCQVLQNNGKLSSTVVDDCVTLPERYDFFLVSQSVRQGTINPTSYNVVQDTISSILIGSSLSVLLGSSLSLQGLVRRLQFPQGCVGGSRGSGIIALVRVQEFLRMNC